MTEGKPPRWLALARELEAIGQTGLAYTRGDYDRHRYARLLSIAAEIAAEYSNLSAEELRADFGAQIGYATPKVDVRGAVLHDGGLLRGRRFARTVGTANPSLPINRRGPVPLRRSNHGI